MKKRTITSFEVDGDVAQMLITISKHGITIRDVANRAIRRYGMKIAREVAAEKRRQLSFERPNVVPLGMELLAA